MTTETRADRDSRDGTLDTVNRRDLHGSGATPPYPPPPVWQQNCAVVVDILIHLAITIVVAVRLDTPVLYTAIVAYVVVSFVHRVALQRWWGATIGRALFGLRCVNTTTGAKATFVELLKAWLLAGYFVVLFVVIPVLDAIGWPNLPHI